MSNKDKSTLEDRFQGYIIDLVILTTLLFTLGYVIEAIFPFQDPTVTDFSDTFMLVSVLLIPFVYHGYFDGIKGGQTIGRKSAKTKLLRNNGGKVTFIRAGLRGLVRYFALFACMWLWWMTDGRTIIDRMFDTKVIKLPK